MSHPAEVLLSEPESGERSGVPAGSAVRLVRTADGQDTGGPGRSQTTSQAGTAVHDQLSAGPAHGRTMPSWPLLVLALPATVAVWSGWVGIGQMTGFGQVHPFPGLWDSFHLDTAVTLPVGVEAYAAYALRAWLSPSRTLSSRTRRFARWSAIGSLLLGMSGQVAYHLLAQAQVTHAPWGITTAVSCLPVLVLGMGAALAHLLRADAQGTDLADQAGSSCPDYGDHRGTGGDQGAGTIRPERLAEAAGAAALLNAAGGRISRRALRAAGVRGSNADLGVLARIIRSQGTSETMPSDFLIPAAPRE